MALPKTEKPVPKPWVPKYNWEGAQERYERGDDVKLIAESVGCYPQVVYNKAYTAKWVRPKHGRPAPKVRPRVKPKDGAPKLRISGVKPSAREAVDSAVDSGGVCAPPARLLKPQPVASLPPIAGLVREHRPDIVEQAHARVVKMRDRRDYTDAQIKLMVGGIGCLEMHGHSADQVMEVLLMAATGQSLKAFALENGLRIGVMGHWLNVLSYHAAKLQELTPISQQRYQNVLRERIEAHAKQPPAKGCR